MDLQKTHEQLEAAKVELSKEFPKEQELKEKSARLAELTLLLKLDKSDREILDDDEGYCAGTSTLRRPGTITQQAGESPACFYIVSRSFYEFVVNTCFYFGMPI